MLEQCDCDVCNKIVECETIEVKEGQDCWLEIKVKCKECGNEMVKKIYC